MKKKCRMWDSREKGAGMRDQDPLPDPVGWMKDNFLNNPNPLWGIRFCK